MARTKLQERQARERDAREKKQQQAKPKPRTARQPALPGTEGVRSVKLDRICEGIGDERETMNKSKNEEASLIRAALELMQKTKLQVYRHAKIELARVPGAEKLRVRLTKEEGDAGEADLVDNDENEGEQVEASQV